MTTRKKCLPPLATLPTPVLSRLSGHSDPSVFEPFDVTLWYSGVPRTPNLLKISSKIEIDFRNWFFIEHRFESWIEFLWPLLAKLHENAVDAVTGSSDLESVVMIAASACSPYVRWISNRLRQLSPQLSCGDTCQIWMWCKEYHRYFCKIENFAYGEIKERSFSNPHPWPPPWDAPFITRLPEMIACQCKQVTWRHSAHVYLALLLNSLRPIDALMSQYFFFQAQPGCKK